MTDIVERLRWCPEYGGWSDAVVLMPEAATEIERLRSQLLDPTSYATSIRERNDEIERLREELADVRADAALLRAALAGKDAT